MNLLRHKSFLFFFVLACTALAIVSSRQPVSGQSGRGSGQNQEGKKQEKPKLPYPLPKIRLPENIPQTPKKKDDDQEVIRINSDLVTVITTISKKTRNDAIDLKQEDFEIVEDGTPQEISNFARDAEQPLNIVLLFDTSLSVAKRLDFERRAAAKFFERVLRLGDRAALFSVSTDVVLMQDFTNRVPQLVQAMKGLKAQGATSLYDAIYLAADYLKDSRGRRIIIMVSDGGDTTSHKGLLEVLNKVQQCDALIYSIFTGNLSPSQNLRDLAAERALDTFAAETGGEVFRPRVPPELAGEEADAYSLRELEFAYNSLAEQLRTQYILGFYSTNEKRDGSFRKLNVRIKKPGYSARTRSGYYAPKS
jgi:Ca-activated chloride channel family protein